MPLNKQLQKIIQALRQSRIKTSSLLNITHFDRLMKKQVSDAQQKNLRLGMFPEAMLRSGLLSQILQSRSQRDFVETLELAANWRAFTTFDNDVPNQSTFSRNWNNPDYIELLDKLFLSFQQLIKSKLSKKQSNTVYNEVNYLKNKYLPLSTDATFIELSTKRFDFSNQGYSGFEGDIRCGAKINLLIDCTTGMPFNYIPTEGKIHESNSFNAFIEDLLVHSHPWLKNGDKQPITPIFIQDKGYWNKKRFIELSESNCGFIIPRKRKMLTQSCIEFLDFPRSKSPLIDATIWIQNREVSFRWLVYENYQNMDKKLDIITNINDLDKKAYYQLYRERWQIEEVFKWLKQYLNIKRPLVESWEGFVIHCYFVLILFLLLQYFLALLNIPRWQENITTLWRQLRHGPSDPWDFTIFKVPMMFLEGGM